MTNLDYASIKRKMAKQTDNWDKYIIEETAKMINPINLICELLEWFELKYAKDGKECRPLHGSIEDSTVIDDGWIQVHWLEDDDKSEHSVVVPFCDLARELFPKECLIDDSFIIKNIFQTKED